MYRNGGALRLVAIALVLTLVVGCADDKERSSDNAETLAFGTTTTQSTAEMLTIASPTSLPTTDPTPTERNEEPTVIVGTPRSEDVGSSKDRPLDAAPTEVSISRDSNFDSDGDGFYTYEELEQAVTALLPQYDFPPRYQVTPDILMMSMKPYAGSDARWRVPMEYTVLGIYHQCAWELTWLDAYRAGDDDLMEESLHQLRTVALESPTIDASLREWMVEMYDRAALGDSTLIQQDVDSSCLMEWASPTPGTPQATADYGERSLADLDVMHESRDA